LPLIRFLHKCRSGVPTLATFDALLVRGLGILIVVLRTMESSFEALVDNLR